MLPLMAYAERHDIHAEADRPGAGTGTNVLDRGFIQWELGFEVSHYGGMHDLTLPDALFRFGVCPWAEMRLWYAGIMAVFDHPDTIPSSQDIYFYSPAPLFIGSKLRVWPGSEEPNLRWIPRTSVLLNLGLPTTKTYAENIPLCGMVDFLFENDLAEWLTLGYDLGVYWTEWQPTPDVFASLAFNFAPTEKLGVFIEGYGIFDPDAVKMNLTNGNWENFTACDINLDFGLTYMAHRYVQLDIYGGINLYHSYPNFSSLLNNVTAGFGVTWLLHHPHEL
jgi:hypothetical protein